MQTTNRLAAFGLTSVLALFASAALAEVEITGSAKNSAGDKITFIVSGESIDGRRDGRPQGLTGVAELKCAGKPGDKRTVSIVGSAALLNTADPAAVPISCPIALFYDFISPTVNHRITINLCDTPPTIGGDFVESNNVGLSCELVDVFGENSGDKVRAQLVVDHKVP